MFFADLDDKNGRASRGRIPLLGAFVSALAVFWGAAILYALHSSLPFNPLRLPGEKRIDLQVWVPERWGFFTRDPREPDLALFWRNEAGAWQPLVQKPHAAVDNGFGIRRTTRARGIEAGLLLNGTRGQDWHECPKDPGNCLASISEGRAFQNDSPSPTLCGGVGLVLEKPVPWAWRRSRSRMPSKVARLEVTCSAR